VDQLNNMLNDVRARLAADADVEKETVTVNLRRMGASSLEIMVRFYVLTRDFRKYLGIQEAILFDLMQIFGRSGLSITSATNTMYVASAGTGAPPVPGTEAAPPAPKPAAEPEKNMGGLLGKRGGS
jgi:hypothetical protein